MSSRVVVLAAESGSVVFHPLLWRKVKVRKSLDEICHYVELTLPESEQGKIRKHDKIEVRLYSPYISLEDNPHRMKRLTTVMVDEATSTVDNAQKGIVVIGRSPARDIIDSAWSDWPLNQEKLETVADEIVTPFFDALLIDKFEIPANPGAVHVTRMPTDGPETGPVFNFNFINESPWTRLITEADKQGLVFTSNEAGNLYLYRAGSGVQPWGFFLTEGQNIRDIQYTQNGAEQFNEYVIKGDNKVARVTDPTCKNKRIKVINLTDRPISEIELERRAKTEMLRRRENRVTVTVSGWGLSEPQIKALGNTKGREIFWNPNFLTPVTIPSLALDDSLLISQVEYTAEPSLLTSAITLVNKEAYS